MGPLSGGPGGSLVWLQAYAGLALLLCISVVERVQPGVTNTRRSVDVVVCFHVTITVSARTLLLQNKAHSLCLMLFNSKTHTHTLISPLTKQSFLRIFL